MAFVHLHVHTQYSLLDGAMSPNELVQSVAALEQPAVAITDSCNLYGAVQFFKACKGAGVHPVLGAKVAVEPRGMNYRDPRDPWTGFTLGLLVENEVGYKNLCKLITNAIFDGMYFRPRIDWDQLRQHADGLIALTGGLEGVVGRAHLRGHEGEDAANLETLCEIFDRSHLYLELQDVALEGQAAVNVRTRELAQTFDRDLVVTNAVHYLKPEDAVTQDVLHAIARAEALDDPLRQPLESDQLYLKSEAEMLALFPDDVDAIHRTAEIAERCDFSFRFDTYHFPATTPPDPEEDADTDANWHYFYDAFPPPLDFEVALGPDGKPPRPEGSGSMNGYFEWFSRKGLEIRLRRVPEEQHPVYFERLEREISIIEGMGFPAYLLIVAEFIIWSKDNGIPVGPGRGSAAGSLVAYAMKITDIDPIRFDLLFERFLNPERVSMPDIDVDFCQDRREEAIEHVRVKYGAPLVSQIITYGKLQAKLAVRDVARVCSMMFQDADRIAKLIPNELNIKLDKALATEERLQLEVEGSADVGRVIRLAQRVEGMTRQTGVHAAGVVIADKPLVEYAPLYRDGPDGGPVVQYDMKSAESIGLIKFDFLGLKTLDQIRDAIVLIERNTGDQVDIDHIPTDDPKTFTLLQSGDALAIFQLESSGMRDLLTRLKPNSLDDVIALIALYRPGPLQSGMVDDFVDRKHGRKAVEYMLPQLEPILDSTYGVVLYQEQVMQTAQILANYSLGEADLLRRAMGKKIAAEMEKQKVRFLQGTQENEIPDDTAGEIFDLLAKFAGYGFNKSHSAAYGMIVYQTAFLKAHYRSEFMAAVMSVESGNTEKLISYIGDCRRAELSVLPPDVNQSALSFDVPADQRDVIRFGLAAVKNVGEGAVENILEARESAPDGEFASFMDFLERIDHSRVNRRVVESLIKAGAFDWTGHARRSLFEGLEGAMRSALRTQAQREAGQVSLFAGGQVPAPDYRFPDVPEWPTNKKLGEEKGAVGLFISGHPLEAYGEELERYTSAPLGQIARCRVDSEVTVAGLISAIRTRRDKRGKKMAFVTLQDATGAIECTFFSRSYERSAEVLGSDQPVLLRGKLQLRGEELKILADSAEPLATVRGARTRYVRICIELVELEAIGVPAFCAALSESPGGCLVELEILRPDGAKIKLSLPPDRGLAAEDALVERLEALFRRTGVVRFG